MKISYYHYYFKERKKRNAKRIPQDISPMIEQYLACTDTDWKQSIEVEDGENFLLLPSITPGVRMLVATKKQELIKAFSSKKFTCTDIQKRLKKDESAGFAAYFQAKPEYIALASTLKGPRSAAFSRFIHLVMSRLGGQNYKFEMQPLGTSITLEQARAMAYVSSSNVKVSPENALFKSLKELFSIDTDDIGSFQVVMRGKKNKNMKDVFEKMAKETDSTDLDRMVIRGRQELNDNLTDYFVEQEGMYTDEIEPGSESTVTKAIKAFTSKRPDLDSLIRNAKTNAVYETDKIPALSRLGDASHWSSCLPSDDVESGGESN